MITEDGVCKKYVVNSNGTLTVVFTLTGLINPLAVQVTPDGSKIYIADGGTSQQVKIYDNSTGALISTFGQAGGYANGPDVTNDKFMFASSKDFQFSSPLNSSISFICFDTADNSWWIWDVGNQRMQHYSSDNTFIENISCAGYNYSCSVNYTVPTRVFSNYLEFEVDYSKPLMGNNGSWKLVKNWSYGVTENKDNQFARLQGITTLGNNRTYAYHVVTGGNEIVELAPAGLRFSGLIFSNSTILDKDGSLLIYEKGQGSSSNPTLFKRRVLTGFDSNNNPTWGTETIIASNTSGQIFPANEGTSFKHQQITSSNVLTYFDEEKSNNYHLGGIRLGTNKWLWRSSPSTNISYRGDYPEDGTFDIGNGINYAGGSMQTIERNIFYSYKGENYKGSQVNKYQQFYDDGLMLGQFGVVGAYANLEGEAAAMMAGNTNTLNIVKVGSDYYLYHNDESYHGGVHRWKITGLNTIQEQIIPIEKNGEPNMPVINYTNLMAGLPDSLSFASGTGSWTYSSPTGETLYPVINYTTYKKTDKDVYINTSGYNKEVKVDLGNNSGLANWKIAGQIEYNSSGEYGSNFIEVLDNSDRIILRIVKSDSYPNNTISINNTTIATGNLSPIINHLNPLTILRSNNTIIVNYGGYIPVTIESFDPTANISNPKTIRFFLDGVGEHKIDIANLKFYSTL